MTRPIGQYRPALRSLVGAQAIDAAGNQHLAPGVHLRVLPAPDLGLPIEPFRVFRFALGRAAESPAARQHIVWRDSNDAFLIEPFDVTPGNPVTGYLPSATQGTCCWIAVLARPGFPLLEPVGPPVIAGPPFSPGRGAGGAGSPVRPGPTVAAAGRPSAIVASPSRGATIPPDPTPLPLPFFGRGLTVEALVLTDSGPQVVASRSRAPFELAATPIEKIRVRGRGRVTGVRWLSVEHLVALAKETHTATPAEFWREMALPVGDGRNYSGAPAQPLEVANERAARTFARRKGLHDVPNVAGPADSPPTTPALEAARLEAPAEVLVESLERLVESSDPAAETHSAVLDLAPDAGDLVGSIVSGVQESVLLSTLEPGVARWLGFGEVDDEPPSERRGDLVAYVIGGSWPGFDPVDGVTRPGHLATAACAVIGHPPDRPRRPTVAGVRSGDWFPVNPPPDARRRIEIELRALVPGAGLALARRKDGEISSLNERVEQHEDELGRSLFPSEPEDGEVELADVDLGHARVFDARAPGEPIGYRIAQHDMFGRWSDWSEFDVSAAERPDPPAPVLFARYQPPPVPDPVPEGLLSGTIHVQVAVPSVAALPPGGRLLTSLELTVEGAVSVISVPDPADPPDRLAEQLAGPGLERGGEAEVTITARWIDEDGRLSQPSDPRVLTLRDPRPAPPVQLPSHLQYTARPDATGQARFELVWKPGPAQDSFRVFYSDEVRLRAGLQELAGAGVAEAARASAVLQEIDQTESIVERAGIFVRESDLFGRRLFEQITDAPLQSGADAELTFVHSVSGALRVLSFYRVVAISAAEVEAPFADATLVPVTVPNLSRPPRPGLTIRPFFPEGSADPLVRVEITVPRGGVPAREYRLRRAIEGAAEAVGMPVVTTGLFGPTNGSTQSVEVVDTGASDFAPSGSFRRWIRYAWVAEVRAARHPGDGPEADWSDPSPSAAYTFVTAGPPEPATDVVLERLGQVHTLRFAHSDPLTGGAPGGYAFDIYVQKPGDHATRVHSIAGDAPPEQGGRDEAGEFRFIDGAERPVGTAYTIVLRDPLGRSSAGTDPVFVEDASNG